MTAPRCWADAASVYLRTEGERLARGGKGAALWKGHENGQGSEQGSDARSHFTVCKENTDLHGEFALQSEALSWVLFLVITVRHASQLSRQEQCIFSVGE